MRVHALHVPALSYASATKEPIWQTTDGQPLVHAKDPLIKPFTVAHETLMFIAISWRYSETLMGLRRIRLKLYWLETSQGSQAQDPVLQCLCSPASSVSTVWGWGGMIKKTNQPTNQPNKQKGSNKCLNCVIISWNAILCFPRAFIYKTYASRDSQQI